MTHTGKKDHNIPTRTHNHTHGQINHCERLIKSMTYFSLLSSLISYRRPANQPPDFVFRKHKARNCCPPYIQIFSVRIHLDRAIFPHMIKSLWLKASANRLHLNVNVRTAFTWNFKHLNMLNKQLLPQQEVSMHRRLATETLLTSHHGKKKERKR